MTLLDRAGEFYAALLLEKKQSDPLVIQFRSYMTNLFQQPGYKLVTEIERQKKEGTLADPNAGKPGKTPKTSAPAYAKGFEPKATDKPARQRPVKPTLRPFQHPAQGLGKTTAPLHRFKRTPKFAAGPESTDQPLPNSEAIPAATTTKAAGGAAAVAGKKPAPRKVGGSFTPAEVEEILSMQPTAIAKKFDPMRIRAYMDSKGVRYNTSASERQIAANLLGHLKQKS